jgi:hypothetical protein
MALIAEQWANSSGHWYGLDGEPCYEIVGKNGNRRNTTLADARKLSLVPSVTTVMREMAKPNLENWIKDQVISAACALRLIKELSDEQFRAQVRENSQKVGRDAADEGTKIHGAIEAYYRGTAWDAAYIHHVRATADRINALAGPQEWLSERSFAHPLGYGGKCDLHSSEWVLDVKTKEFADEDKCTLYDEHAMQLAAYRRGLNVPEARCGIVFVSRTVPGVVVVREIPEPDLVRGREMFDCLLRLWQVKTGHKPNGTRETLSDVRSTAQAEQRAERPHVGNAA